MNRFILKLLKLVKPLSLMTVFALLPHATIATEVDNYTYSHIQLEDIKDVINDYVNSNIRKIVEQTTDSIRYTLAHHHSVSSAAVESRFFSYWEEAYGAKGVNPYFRAISNIEHCISVNNCEGWPKIERIIHLPQDSIYGRSNFSVVTEAVLAPVVNVCGVRIGGDKLTHFFYDGRMYYNQYMNNKSDKEIQDLMEETENEIMGLEFTGVYSESDIVVNYKGMEFFKNILITDNPYVVWSNANRKLIQVRDFDICDYVDSTWDESVLKSKFDEDGRDALEKVIAQEKENPSQINREELLSRKPQPLGMVAVSKMVYKEKWAVLKTFGHSLGDYSLQESDRRKINIKVQK